MRISNNLITLLVPAMLFAAPSSGRTDVRPTEQQTVPLSATISVVDASPTKLTVKCDFDHSWLSNGSGADSYPPLQSLTRWVQVSGDDLPVINNTECLFSSASTSSAEAGRTAISPTDLVQIGNPITQRGVRLVPITFNSFAPAQHGEVSPIESITTEISFPDDDAQSRRLRPILDEMWGELILNRELPARDRENETSQGLYVYVIPDNINVRNTLNPLIQWRRQQGYTTREISCPEWADADFVSQQLLDLDTPETPIDFILLAGDVTGNFQVPTNFRGIESDYYFSFLDGSDRIPDAAVGRLSYNTIAELERIVAKILNYEQRPDVQDPGWLRRGAISAGSSQSGFSTILVSRWLRNQFVRSDFTSVDTLWYTMGGRVGDFMEEEFNRGVAYVSYRGWTGLEDWSPIQAGGLRNHYLPTTILLACNSGDYAGQQTGFTEALLRAPGGAIAAIGVAGSQSRINFNNVMLASFFRGVLDGGVYRVGWALNRARINLMATYGTRESELTVDHSAWTNLMGDPATVIWRGIPQAVRITVPQQVDYGVGMFRVTVVNARTNQPIPNVRVGFNKTNEATSAEYTDNQGQATIHFDNRRLSPGAGVVTVSGDMVLPSTAQVQMTRPNQTLTLQSLSITEDNMAPHQGNGNEIAEPNEVIGLTLSLMNIGTQVIQAPTNCEISTESDYCEIRVAGFQIAQAINPNTAAQAIFLISLGPDFPDRENIAFTLTARNNESVWTSEFDINGWGPRWTITQIDLPNLPFPNDVPSFDIFLRNDGSIDLGITQAELISDDDNAEVFAGIAEYDSLSVGEIGSVGRVYSVIFDESVEYGSKIPFHLDLTCEGNYSATIPLTIQIAALPLTHPSGPDAYGYYAIDQQDFGSNLRPNYRWEELNPRLGGSGHNTGLLDQGEDDDQSVVLDLPFTVQYYGREYDQITVCTNGWAAFGSQPEYVDFRSLPIGSPQGPRAQLCPWWMDLYQPGIEANVFYYYDAPRHRYIIEWFRMRHWVGPAGPGAVETFEIILNDPDWYQNSTGDGDIFFVYNEISHDGRVDAHGTPYATVGLGNPDDDGGMQLAFWNRFAPGITPPNAGVIYRFMTTQHQNYALLTGTVRHLGEAVRGATVRATKGGWTFTNADGYFRLVAIIADAAQQIEVSAPGFNTARSQEFVVGASDSLNIIVDLLQPQVVSDVEAITDSLDSGDLAFHRFTLRNPGNGLLTVNTRAAEHIERQILGINKAGVAGRDDPDDFGDLRLTIPVTELTDDSRILGVAYDGNYYIVSGGNNGEAGNSLYRFDQHGDFVDHFDQPVDGIWGMHDLAWDGTNLYGGVGEWIIKMQRMGGEISRFASPIIPARGIAVSPIGDYWIAGEGQPILKLTNRGELVRSYPTSLNIYGLAWHPADPDGYPLWIFCTDGPTGLFVCKMDTSTGEIHSGLNIEPQQGDRPGGIELSKRWNDRVWSLAVIIQNPDGDRVDLYEVGNNFSWLTINPASAVIQPDFRANFDVIIASEGLEGGDYIADVLVTHDAMGGQLRIPVSIYVEPVLASVDPDKPETFTLDSVFPNPSNGSANIQFTIPISGRVNLQIFDTQGRLITQLVDREMQAGHHSEIFEAILLPAGIYIVTLTSSNETFIQKFALVK